MNDFSVSPAAPRFIQCALVRQLAGTDHPAGTFGD
jgi:hypothetical protein